MNPISLAQAIPVKWRQFIYSVLGTLILLEAIFDIVDGTWETKIMQALAVLGFGTALSNTVPSPPE